MPISLPLFFLRHLIREIPLLCLCVHPCVDEEDESKNVSPTAKAKAKGGVPPKKVHTQNKQELLIQVVDRTE